MTKKVGRPLKFKEPIKLFRDRGLRTKFLGQTYYYINDDGSVSKTIYTGDDDDEARFKAGNFHPYKTSLLNAIKKTSCKT